MDSNRSVNAEPLENKGVQRVSNGLRVPIGSPRMPPKWVAFFVGAPIGKDEEHDGFARADLYNTSARRSAILNFA